MSEAALERSTAHSGRLKVHSTSAPVYNYGLCKLFMRHHRVYFSEFYLEFHSINSINTLLKYGQRLIYIHMAALKYSDFRKKNWQDFERQDADD